MSKTIAVHVRYDNGTALSTRSFSHAAERTSLLFMTDTGNRARKISGTQDTRLSEKSFVLFIQYPPDLSRLRRSLGRFAAIFTLKFMRSTCGKSTRVLDFVDVNAACTWPLNHVLRDAQNVCALTKVDSVLYVSNKAFQSYKY